MYSQLHRSTRGCKLKQLAWRRHGSSKSSQYHPKVRALPFVATPHEVLERMSTRAAMTVIRDDYHWISAWAAKYLSSFGLGKHYLPSRLLPLYFPAWVLEGWASVRREGKDKLYLGIDSSHIPGNAHQPLSRMTFADPANEHFAPVPFTPEIKRQHDMDVLCLPYTFTPSDLSAWIRSDIPSTEYNLKSLETELSWYPILLPVYLLKYEATLDGEPFSVTYAVEGYRKNGVHWIDTSDMQVATTKLRNSDSASGLQWILEIAQRTMGREGILASSSPSPSNFLRTHSVSRTSLDEMLTGGPPLQELFRAKLNHYVPDVWTAYEAFWKEQHQEQSAVHWRDFEQRDTWEYDDSIRGRNHFLAAGVFFHDILKTKLEMAITKSDDGLSYFPFELPVFRGKLVSSYNTVNPDGIALTQEADARDVNIELPLAIDPEVLAGVKTPVTVKIVQNGSVLGRIYVHFDPNFLPKAEAPAAREEKPRKTLDVEIRWQEEDEDAKTRVKAALELLTKLSTMEPA